MHVHCRGFHKVSPPSGLTTPRSPLRFHQLSTHSSCATYSWNSTFSWNHLDTVGYRFLLPCVKWNLQLAMLDHPLLCVDMRSVATNPQNISNFNADLNANFKDNITKRNYKASATNSKKKQDDFLRQEDIITNFQVWDYYLILYLNWSFN